MHILCKFYAYFMQFMQILCKFYARATFFMQYPGLQILCKFYANFMHFMHFMRFKKNYALYAPGTLLMQEDGRSEQEARSSVVNVMQGVT